PEIGEANRVHKKKKQKKRTLPHDNSDRLAGLWMIQMFLVQIVRLSDHGMVVDEGEQDFTNPTDCWKLGLEDD
ncbi:hypothetical protein Tco_0977756, partial [Tanacetum coccineum]